MSASAEDHRRRPSMPLARVVELLVAALGRARGDHSSVELNRNARGDTQVRVAVRTGEGGVETIEEAVAQARSLYDQICSAYPMKETDAKP